MNTTTNLAHLSLIVFIFDTIVHHEYDIHSVSGEEERERREGGGGKTIIVSTNIPQ